MKAGKYVLIIFAILLLGLALRVNDLAEESLWLDEGHSIRVAQLNPPDIITYWASDVHPPLHFVTLHYWIKLFGDSEFSTRFLSVIFGLLGLLMFYKVGTIIFDKETGIFTAFLAAISVFYIAVSQEASLYSLAIFLALLSVYFFIELFENKKLSSSVAYVIATTLLIHTFYSGLFIVLVQNVFILTLMLFPKKRPGLNFKRWIALQAAVLILYVPWLLLSIKALGLTVADTVSAMPAPSVYDILVRLKGYAGTYLTLFIFLPLAILSLIPEKKFPKGAHVLSYFNRIYFLALWFFVPVAVIFIMARQHIVFFATRFIIVASLPFYILVARRIKSTRRKFIKAAILIFISLMFLSNITLYFTEVNRNQWREVAGYIDANSGPRDVVIFHKGYFQENVFDYYSKKEGLLKIPFPETTRGMPTSMRKKLIGVTADDISAIWPEVKKHNRVWIVYSHNHDKDGLIKKMLAPSYDEILNKQYFGIEVYLYEAKNK